MENSIPNAADLADRAAGDISKRRWLWLLLLIVAAQAAASYIFLGAIRLGTHEQLAALRARELVTHGSWVVPHLNGQPNVAKPPLPLWLVNIAAMPTGGEITEYNARFFSVLSALAMTVVTAVLCRSIMRTSGLKYSGYSSLVAAFMFASSVSALVWGRRAEVDIQLSFWISLCLLFYWLAVNAGDRSPGSAAAADAEPPTGGAGPSGSGRRLAYIYTLAGWAAMIIAILTKGPLPILQLLVVVLVMGFAAKIWPTRVAAISAPVGMLMFFAAGLPWLIAIQRVYPQVFDVWYNETIGRLWAGNMTAGHSKEPWFYLLRFWGLLAPWLVPVAVGLYLGFRRRLGLSARAWIFLLAWGVGTLIVLSASSGKRVRYALVCVVPFFIIAAAALQYVWTNRQRLGKYIDRTVAAHALISPLALIGAIVLAVLYKPIAAGCIALGVIVAITVAVAYWYYRQRRLVAAFAAIAVMLVAAMPVMSASVAPHFESISKNTGVAIGKYLHDQGVSADDVCFYRTRNMGTVFYIGAPMTEINAPDNTDPAILAEWAAAHPGGYVVIRDQRGLKQIRQVGSCEKVDFFGPGVRPPKSRYNLWRFTGGVED